VIASAYKRDVAYAADELLFRTPVLADVALVKLLGECCVQDMCRVLRGAEKLKKLARKYTKVGVYRRPTTYRVSSSMLTRRRTQRITTAIRSLRVFPSAGNFLHDPGHRWVKTFECCRQTRQRLMVRRGRYTPLMWNVFNLYAERKRCAKAFSVSQAA
jgi:hypothetical protein